MTGAELGEWLAANRMTQADLVERLARSGRGVTKQRVSQWVGRGDRISQHWQARIEEVMASVSAEDVQRGRKQLSDLGIMQETTTS